jgi:SAM-dependent methyltransferase
VAKDQDLDGSQLSAISARTLAYYEQRAEAFWEGTRDHDVSQNRQALLRHLDVGRPARILDLGCGPGRDLHEFRKLGHDAVGLDGTLEFCAMARSFSGCDVLHQDLLALTLPQHDFDGIFANASLFHVPTKALPRVLDALWLTLRPHGVLFASNPRGNGEENWQGGRFGAFHDHDAWRNLLNAAGFDELEHYYRPPDRPRHEQPWLATVFRKHD